MISQNKMILQRLKSGGTIKAIDALNDFGCFRLGSRINDLRNEGHDIITKMVKSNKKTFAEYSLAKDQK